MAIIILHEKSLTQQKSSQGADPFYWMRVILASNRGTLMEPENSVFQVQVDVAAYSLQD